MSYPLRRKRQKLDAADVEAILTSCTSGVLSVNDSDGFPYAVPLSFAYSANTLYFHCATHGQKLDALAADDRACFTVIAADEIVPEKFTTKFRSVIAQGHTHLVEDATEKRQALEMLVAKYSPTFKAAGAKTIAEEWTHTQVIRLDIESICGKEGMELVKLRK
ncbi:MAG: pyridoxamine 5'-phosphate oxidase family protein [Raoultibacter sp.]